WEETVFDSNEQEKLVVQGRLSYDARNHRERILEKIAIGHQNNSYDRIALFDSQIEYIYDFNAQNCTRRSLTRSWRDFGIRSDAQSYGEAYVGTAVIPGLGLLVTMWGANYTTSSNDTIRDFGSWTYQHCLPVNLIRYSQKYGRTQTTFFNIIPSISNTSVFIPRKECLTKEEEYLLYDKSSKMTNL
ncbi:unnamed protein product, partial [Adineta steineri]